MAASILVTGGTGTLGRHVVPGLRAAGRDLRVLSRKPHRPTSGVEYVVGDVETGAGLDEAVRGVETIVHLAGTAKRDDEKARNLVRAAGRAGSPHIVYISVVGADRVPVVSRLDRAMFGYLGYKCAAEQVIADSGLPYTTLRATQFHDLVFMVAQQLARLPIVPAFSGTRFQPIDARDVADRLIELTLGEPAGLVSELGGPRAYPFSALLRSYLRAAGKRRLIVPVRQPGKAAEAVRSGAILTPEHAVAGHTWEAFLADRVRAAGARVGQAAARPTS